MSQAKLTLADLEAAERSAGIVYTSVRAPADGRQSRRHDRLGCSTIRTLGNDNAVPMASSASTLAFAGLGSAGRYGVKFVRPPAAPLLPGDAADIAFAPVTALSAWIASGQIRQPRADADSISTASPPTILSSSASPRSTRIARGYRGRCRRCATARRHLISVRCTASCMG